MLKNKTIIITGANGVLGRAVIDVAQAQGAELIGFDRIFDGNRDDLRQVVVDLADPKAVAEAIENIAQIDGLFNIAGGFAMGPAVHETKASEWDAMFAMNFLTARNMCEAVVPRMIKAGGGKIVNVGALSAREGQGNMGAYCVAKSAVMRMTESMSKELRDQGINVNAVLPSILDTPTNRGDMPDADHTKWVHPKQLAEVISFLGSDAAAAVHGALLPVSGLS
ncbi:MAG: NAD(P)-dependent dehydrogenase (short-subunit alcohol dehydrogenase family) [Gammaproteobacteria bacterium]|jgi:NAD(P)-dependent dehydrogenase (short-subunit alcohol dehydrogenase family)